MKFALGNFSHLCLPFFNLSGIERFSCREGGTLLAESSAQSHPMVKPRGGREMQELVTGPHVAGLRDRIERLQSAGVPSPCGASSGHPGANVSFSLNKQTP